MTHHPCFKPERIFIVEYQDEIIGTAAAWIEPERDPGVGYLHMVGILPEHRGHHLGALLTVEAIRYTRHEGFAVQRLLTDDHREAAIRLYLDLGYYPLLTHESHAERWRALGEKLNRREAVSRARNLL
ncbi:MAG: GNAT family N-acetyltransferase [Candidatus Hydrogenedentes bacterium]|nr:GNAT family N-acetyltransferase [Candidatus Hydrogenedentota bacterium]